jgi:hypothetical protein
MSADEVFDLLGKLDADEAAVAADLPDLVRLFLATGERTGEALAADWEDFDADAKQLTMAGHVIRATDKGRVINRGKTDNAVRPVPLADWCVRMLVNRHTRPRLPGRRADLPQLNRHHPRGQQRPEPRVEPVQEARRVRVGHLPHVPQDRSDAARRGRLTARQIADILRPRAPADDAGRLHGPRGTEPGRRERPARCPRSGVNRGFSGGAIMNRG